jgi:predicted transcriptional regulator
MVKKLPRPTDAELEILTALWSLGPSTVRDIHTAIEARKPAQYTTVLKLLQIMAEKGHVRRDEKQRAHVTKPRSLRKRRRDNSQATSWPAHSTARPEV